MWTFSNIFKTTIWGGERIPEFKNLETSERQIGESWEISGVDGSESVVADGPDKGTPLHSLLHKYGASLLGARNYEKYGDSFPLLIKFIDAAQDLSVQVHPDDELARKRGAKFGKTEMWYVVDSAPGARLANGFKSPVDPADYERLVSTGEIEEALRFCPIAPGDVFFIPAGRVHAIGKGAFVAEIQETSDITYRLYDYRRKDAEGRERQLHTAEAFDAIDFNDDRGRAVDYTPQLDEAVKVVESPFFTTEVIKAAREMKLDFSGIDSFKVIIAVEGKCVVEVGDEAVVLTRGKSLLIPATAQSVDLIPTPRFSGLVTYIA